MLSDEQLLRYSRQIMLQDVDIEGQTRWLQSTVLILGVGGLGSPAALYLAAAGVGTLILVDDDQVELTNLQRQIAHTTDRIGMMKVASAADAIQQINPDTKVIQRTERLDEVALTTLVGEVDVVLDCTDNFTTRFAVNRACVVHQKPLVSGAAIRMEGQIAVFQPGLEGSPCYQCLYKEGEDEHLTCSESGVLSPLVGIIGSMQALEALKVLADMGTTLTGRLLLLDAKHMEWRSLLLKPDPKCPVCSKK